ncbi:MAG TPA: MFS transporter, partial [Candidatus Methylomirabilis sp.]|nr:MFS transporter [Candidatus Methylomirabilis sp.]
MPDPREFSPGRPGRFALFLGAMFCQALAVGVLPPLLPLIQGSLLLTTPETGLIAGAFGFARLCCDLPIGYLADRIGHRLGLLLGAAGIVTGTLLSAGAPGLPSLLVARGLVGVGHAFVSIGSLSLLLHAGPPGARGRTTNWMELTGVCAFTAGSLLGGQVGAAIGWRGAFLAAAAPALLGGILIAVTLPLRGPAARSGRMNPGFDSPAGEPALPRATILRL